MTTQAGCPPCSRSPNPTARQRGRGAGGSRAEQSRLAASTRRNKVAPVAACAHAAALQGPQAVCAAAGVAPACGATPGPARDLPVQRHNGCGTRVTAGRPPSWEGAAQNRGQAAPGPAQLPGGFLPHVHVPVHRQAMLCCAGATHHDPPTLNRRSGAAPAMAAAAACSECRRSSSSTRKPAVAAPCRPTSTAAPSLVGAGVTSGNGGASAAILGAAGFSAGASFSAGAASVGRAGVGGASSAGGTAARPSSPASPAAGLGVGVGAVGGACSRCGERTGQPESACMRVGWGVPEGEEAPGGSCPFRVPCWGLQPASMPGLAGRQHMQAAHAAAGRQAAGPRGTMQPPAGTAAVHPPLPPPLPPPGQPLAPRPPPPLGAPPPAHPCPLPRPRQAQRGPQTAAAAARRRRRAQRRRLRLRPPPLPPRSGCWRWTPLPACRT